ncbi:hypothetical protein H4S06_005100 [Coemansia sp. BCRC 34490]|nr:hypothetical protein H4S06_005100 [Coemansia sp. BCRC 34490]
MVVKPFKSPARQPATSAAAPTSPKHVGSAPPTPRILSRATRRPVTTESGGEKEDEGGGITPASSKQQPPPPLLLPGNTPGRTPSRLTRRLSSRLSRMSPIRTAAATGSAGTSGSSKHTQRLVQEKTQLVRLVGQAKEEMALVERARVLASKKEAAVVAALVAKWQVACSAAADDLFGLLRPAMEARQQADATERAFGPETNANTSGADKQHGGNSNTNEEAAGMDAEYMLRLLGIDPELF